MWRSLVQLNRCSESVLLEGKVGIKFIEWLDGHFLAILLAYRIDGGEYRPRAPRRTAELFQQRDGILFKVGGSGLDFLFDKIWGSRKCR
ncbi:MAG: hypothetical protein IPL59_05205 [Candidatus Competibacteraceae bacterium]|nr:hypothetical protein [Candidatus Competibacteraceae bacterium]